MKDPVSFSQKTLFHDTRRIQFFLADCHVSLEAVKTATKTSLVYVSLLSMFKVTFHFFFFYFVLNNQKVVSLSIVLFENNFHSRDIDGNGL